MAGYGSREPTYDGVNSEHETTRLQKQRWAEQQAADQQAQQVNWNQDREMFERQLLGQEQARKQYDSQTARAVGEQKYGMLGGLLQGLMRNNNMDPGPQGTGWSWAARSRGRYQPPERA